MHYVKCTIYFINVRCKGIVSNIIKHMFQKQNRTKHTFAHTFNRHVVQTKIQKFEIEQSHSLFVHCSHTC